MRLAPTARIRHPYLGKLEDPAFWKRGSEKPDETWDEYKTRITTARAAGIISADDASALLRAEMPVDTSAYHESLTSPPTDSGGDLPMTKRFSEWWSCGGKKAPGIVPNAFAVGACYVRNTGLVVGAMVALGFILFATKQIGD